MGEYGAAFVGLNMATIIALLIFTRLSPAVIFLSASALLYLSGILALEQVLDGFTNLSLLVLSLLYLVAVPLERTTFMRRVTQAIVNGSTRTSILRLGIIGGACSAFINNTAVVAAMLSPLKRQQGIPPSRLLLPLSYASILGGTLTLIGTSTNLIINGFVQQAGLPSLNFFDFTMIGLPVFAGSLLCMVALGPKLLPARKSNAENSQQGYFLERRIQRGSPLSGRSVQANGLRQLERIFLIEVIRQRQVIAPVSPQETLYEGDTLVFSGDLSALDLLDDFEGLDAPEQLDPSLRENLVEVIVSPTADIVGRTIKQVDFRARFDAAVVALRRGDQRLQGGLGQLTLKAGDTLVLAIGDDFNRRREIAADFILIGGIDTRRPLTQPAELSVLGGFAAIVALGATGFMPLVKGLIVLMALLLLTRILTIDDIKARFPFELVMVIGGALGLAQAMLETGMAERITVLASTHLAGLTPVGALIGVFLLTWLLTELITNNAAAAIMFPLALAVSAQWGDNYLPFVMAVAFGASASFLSPYGYQTNLMVYSAGNYRVSNYLRFGLPVLLVYSSIAISMIVLMFNL